MEDTEYGASYRNVEIQTGNRRGAEAGAVVEL